MYRSFGYGLGLPRAVKSLLIANAVVFIITLFIPWHIRLLNTTVSGWNLYFGLVPVLINHRFMVWQFFTYMFLHGGFGHILLNMFALWMFGTELEYNWGHRDFLKFYLICGVGGGVLVWLTSMVGFSSPAAPTIGASGAIFGILLAYGMMWPDRPIFVFGILPMKALHFVIIFGAINLMQGLSRSGGGVAYFAHVGGLITGFVYLKYGWRIMVYYDSYMKKFKARKFTVHQGGKSTSRSTGGSKSNFPSSSMHPDLEEEVDHILDKIAREGMDSLTDSEKRVLERASKKRK